MFIDDRERTLLNMKNKKKIIFGSILLLSLNILILKSHFGKKNLAYNGDN